MSKHVLGRREFLTAASAGVTIAVPGIAARGSSADNASKLAILGGDPVRKGKGWPSWPPRDEDVVDASVSNRSPPTIHAAKTCTCGCPQLRQNKLWRLISFPHALQLRSGSSFIARSSSG